MTVSDEELVIAFQNGNDLAFVNLYNRYKHSIYIFCLKMINEADNAKDIVQGVFLKIYERQHQLKRSEKFKSWMFTIARNDCLTYLRKASYSSELPDEMEDVDLILPHRDVEKDEEIILVKRAVDRLKPELKEIVILREYENLSYKEIAEVVNTTESIVKSRLFIARQKLYELLKPIYVERKQL
jgi:RNA polymerase sigma-70 factor (ECF subfamily)